MSINPKKPTKGLLLGTDFRHAVEFSRSGRATNSTLAGFVGGRLLEVAPRGGPALGPSRRPPSGGLARRRGKVTCARHRCQTAAAVTPDTPCGTGSSP